MILKGPKIEGIPDLEEIRRETIGNLVLTLQKNKIPKKEAQVYIDRLKSEIKNAGDADVIKNSLSKILSEIEEATKLKEAA